jgi:hypothetical protein
MIKKISAVKMITNANINEVRPSNDLKIFGITCKIENKIKN